MKTLKKMRYSVAALSLLLLMGTIAAVAATSKPGSAQDPLVSQSYISDTYIPNVLDEMASRAAEKTEPLLTQAKSELSTTGERILTVQQGEILQIYAGGSLTLISGTATVDSISGTLVDATDGTECTAGSAITQFHRYLVAENSSIDIGIKSETAQMTLIQSTPSEESLPFDDVKTTDWYYTYVQYVYENQLFKGTTESTFSPNGEMNRAMLATVLYRFSGEVETDFANPFKDILAESWYTDGVTWAASKGIVSGMGDATFAPEIAVTREQIAVMLYRFAADYLNLPVSASGDLSKFKDADSISSWALTSVSWAVDNGVISGKGDGTLKPNMTATRAEVSAMMQRFSTFITQ